MMIKCLSILALLSLFVVATSFGIDPFLISTSTRICRPNLAQKDRLSVVLPMGGPQDVNVRRPSNEFSRTVPPDMVLKLHGGKHNPTQQRQYSVDIDASGEECAALASRFQLPEITSLEASLLLSPEGSNGVGDARGILVEGSVEATVTRTCVRTNENFQEEVEFAVYSLVRPVGNGGSMVPLQAEKEASVVQLSRSKKNKKKRKNEQSAYDEDNIDPMEMLKMQSMLDNLEEQEDDYEDVLMEDEAIFATNGMLDIGELVSQLLWLNLDPYPKKPGGPEVMKFSITG